jgi:hypothetical protein
MRRAAVTIAAIGLVGAAVIVWQMQSAPAPTPMAVEAPEWPAREPSGASAKPPMPSADAPRAETPPPVPAPVAARRDDRTTSSEPALMALLRDIGETAPARSLDLARAGQRRFPDSPDAPERAFIIIRSLVNLRRFHEAQDEARDMVRKYPDNPLALDAQRHLLVYPLDQPSREEMQRRDQ